MKRRVFTIICALSLLLSVAVVAVWARSMFVGDAFYRHFYQDEGGYTMVIFDGMTIGRGGAAFGRRVYARSPVGPIPLKPRYGPWPFHRTMKPEYPYLGYPHKPKLFLWVRSEQRLPNGGTVREVEIVVPFWAILLPVGTPALLMARRDLRRYIMLARRKRSGRCPSCGYDLRATPDRCPECGAAAAVT